MKPPKPKIHLIDVSEPITVFCGLQMRCGEIIDNAVPKFFAEDDIALQFESAIQYRSDTCQNCRKLPADRISGVPYFVYGLVEKQKGKASEVKDGRSSSEI